MGYGNKYRKRRIYKSRRRTKRYRGTFKQMRRTAKRVYVKMSETKFKIDNITSNINNTSGFEKIYGNNITVGTGNDQRIGNQIRMKRIGFDFVANYNIGSTTFPSAWFRIILAYPRKGLSSSDLTTYFTATNPGVHGRLDPDQAICMYDKKFLLCTVNSGNGQTYCHLKYYKWVKLMVCNYEDITSSIDNAPVIYMTTDASIIGGASVSVQGTASVSYIDA